MTLRAIGFCFLRFVLLARSIARLTGFISDQTPNCLPTAGAAGAFAIGAERQRSLVDDALCRIHPG
jgi:hypothetical protein